MTTQWRKPSWRKGSFHDRATSLPKQDWLLAKRLTELLRLSSMQISSSRTRRISRHFRHDLPLRARKPSTRHHFPQALGRKGCPQVCRGTPQPRFCHVLLLQILGQERLQSQENHPRLTIYWLVTIGICLCQSNYGSTGM